MTIAEDMILTRYFSSILVRVIDDTFSLKGGSCRIETFSSGWEMKEEPATAKKRRTSILDFHMLQASNDEKPCEWSWQ